MPVYSISSPEHTMTLTSHTSGGAASRLPATRMRSGTRARTSAYAPYDYPYEAHQCEHRLERILEALTSLSDKLHTAFDKMEADLDHHAAESGRGIKESSEALEESLARMFERRRTQLRGRTISE